MLSHVYALLTLFAVSYLLGSSLSAQNTEAAKSGGSPSRIASAAASFATVATPELARALDSEGAVSSAVLIRFFIDPKTNTERRASMSIRRGSDLEDVRVGLLNAVRPVFVEHPDAEAGTGYLAMLRVVVNNTELVFWAFEVGFSVVPEAVQGKLFFSAGLADVIDRTLAQNNYPRLPARARTGLLPPDSRRTSVGTPPDQDTTGIMGPGLSFEPDE